jgi:hypothetical protein
VLLRFVILASLLVGCGTSRPSAVPPTCDATKLSKNSRDKGELPTSSIPVKSAEEPETADEHAAHHDRTITNHDDVDEDGAPDYDENSGSSEHDEAPEPTEESAPPVLKPKAPIK